MMLNKEKLRERFMRDPLHAGWADLRRPSDAFPLSRAKLQTLRTWLG